MDPLEQVIRKIHKELERRCVRVITIGVTKLDKDKHKTPPAVLWVEQGGIPEAPNANIPDTLTFDVSRVNVSVFGESAEYCRLLWWNLMQAAKKAWGADLEWLERTPPKDSQQSGHAIAGFVIDAVARIYLRVPLAALRLPNGQNPPTDTIPRQVVDHRITANVSGNPLPSED